MKNDSEVSLLKTLLYIATSLASNDDDLKGKYKNTVTICCALIIVTFDSQLKYQTNLPLRFDLHGSTFQSQI